MKTKHTPGPWIILQQHEGTVIVSDKGTNMTASVRGLQLDANARLIEQAPAMLATLQALEDWLTDPTRPLKQGALDALATVRAAIEAATGERS